MASRVSLARVGGWMAAVAASSLLGCVEAPLAEVDCDDPVVAAQMPEACASGETGGVGDPDDSRMATDSCGLSPTVAPGQYGGSLFGADGEQGGACGAGGPDVFVRLQVQARADVRARVVAEGFAPQIELRGGGCAGDALLACGTEGEVSLDDVPGGTELVVVIGAASDDPGLNGGTVESLSFDLSLSATPILLADDICHPVELGRCVEGTACLPEGDGAMDLDWRCRPVPGDACGTALTRINVSGDATASLDLPQPLSDAHAHSCGGAGQVDYVIELDLASSLGTDQTLRIQSDGVGLAVRWPWCDASAEIACADPSVGMIELPNVGELAAGSARPLLFVDWPEGIDPGPSLQLDLSLVTP